MLLLKHTHTHTQNNINKIIIKSRQYQPPFPRKKHHYNTPNRGPHGKSQRIGAVNFCHKDFHSRGYRDPKSNSILM